MDKNKKIFKLGKLEMEKFYQINIPAKTGFISQIIAYLLAIITILPLGLLLSQTILIYGYNVFYLIICLVFGWIIAMLFNGVANYLTVSILKLLHKDNDRMQSINSNLIFKFQATNMKFGILALIFIIVVIIGRLGIL